MSSLQHINRENAHIIFRHNIRICCKPSHGLAIKHQCVITRPPDDIKSSPYYYRLDITIRNCWVSIATLLIDRFGCIKPCIAFVLIYLP